ncbi:thioesterase domain-containing protein [Pseudomonas batumici]|uniref:thioesterase domain-containing protein n=1 Tax=Pseudomonas batumici TaxID=226910 RepID=UPI000694B3C0|nr:thioesterase domain-containing protein [Pseudomonas batumici]
MDRLIKSSQLDQLEKHKVESPFFAAGKVQDALDGKGIGGIYGVSEFAAEHKKWLNPIRSIALSQIETILESQQWYLLLERPFSPLFPKTLSTSQSVTFGSAQRLQTESEQPYTPAHTPIIESPIPKDGLTVYLGGAGMEGDYISSQIEKLRFVGIDGAIAGKITEGLPGDAAAVIKYRYPVRSISGLSATGPYKISTDWSLKALGISRQLPKNGQFNLIGYSWGSLVAAQTALFYAEKGTFIDHLVLIGSPISQEFLSELRETDKIKRVLIIDLTEQNDKIHAGMSETELIASLPSLGEQMLDSQLSDSGQGHFFYGIAGKEGETRRRELAERLKVEGLQ